MQAERAKSHERGGKQHAMGMQHQGKSVWSEKLAWGWLTEEVTFSA